MHVHPIRPQRPPVQPGPVFPWYLDAGTRAALTSAHAGQPPRHGWWRPEPAAEGIPAAARADEPQAGVAAPGRAQELRPSTVPGWPAPEATLWAGPPGSRPAWADVAATSPSANPGHAVPGLRATGPGHGRRAPDTTAPRAEGRIAVAEPVAPAHVQPRARIEPAASRQRPAEPAPEGQIHPDAWFPTPARSPTPARCTAMSLLLRRLLRRRVRIRAGGHRIRGILVRVRPEYATVATGCCCRVRVIHVVLCQVVAVELE